jgi:hypothetical protein
MMLHHVDLLAELAEEAFGAADQRANPDYLRTLAYDALLDVYGTSMDTITDNNIKAGKLDWFMELSCETKIGLIRLHNRDPELAEAESARLKKAYEERKRAEGRRCEA